MKLIIYFSVCPGKENLVNYEHEMFVRSQVNSERLY
jgi:hypothetical protein